MLTVLKLKIFLNIDVAYIYSSQDMYQTGNQIFKLVAEICTFQFKNERISIYFF